VTISSFITIDVLIKFKSGIFSRNVYRSICQFFDAVHVRKCH